MPGVVYLTLHRDPLGFLERAAREYGDILHMQFGPRHDYLISGPDFIESILLASNDMARSTQLSVKRLVGNGILTSRGEVYRRQRKLMQPFFHAQRNEAYAGVILRCATRLSAQWKPGETRDIAVDMRHLALAIVAEALFGSDIKEHLQEICEHMDVVLDMTDSGRNALADMLLNKWLTARLPLPSGRRLKRSIQTLDAIVYGMIDRQKQTSGDQDHLLSGLCAHALAGEGRTQVRDEIMTMLLAGHETTASALTWTWYLLSEHPDVAAKMRSELDRVLGGRLPTFDDLPQLTYTRSVLAESMRLYPPVWLMGRRPVRDFPLGDYVIPTGAHVHVCQYVVHRDPRYFPDPTRFDPTRWTSGAEPPRPKFAYFPFGAGTRKCIGEELAWTEGVLVLAALGQQWRLQLVPGHPVEPQPRITLHPKDGLLMTLERNDATQN
jgi:cytochrome P450